MDACRSFRLQRGQAAVEHVGIVAVVALLLTAASLWAAAHLRLPAGPPPVLEHAVRPLAPPAVGPLGDLAYRGPWYFPPGRTDEPIGRALRATRDVVADAGGSFADGFLDRMREHLRAAVRDPIGSLLEPIDQMTRTPPTVWELSRRTFGDLREYLGRLRGLSAREVVEVVARDVGRAAADALLARIVRAASRAATRLGDAPRRRGRTARRAPRSAEREG
jgi:hypothetical protein